MVIYMSKQKNNIEILAPVGNFESLQAALASGADAVYLGLTSLNARRGAANFEPEMLSEVVSLAHEHDTAVYLTLNIDLTDREVGQAFRIVELASQAGVDAVLVRDPALLFLPSFYPNLQFHFSTQAACCNSADIKMAEVLGIKRVVLARENSLEEIKQINAVNALETEVFVQGALCFSVSGRCMLSSWGGGRSGNRGTCTSPCRVPWGTGGEVGTGTPFSMHDLSAVAKVPELAEAGVHSLKIEGRLKKPEWVSEAVTLYKNAVEHRLVNEDTIRSLGDYTGRQVVDSFLAGCTTGLTGRSGRIVSDFDQITEVEEPSKSVEKQVAPGKTLSISLNVTGAKILLAANCEAHNFEREITKSKAGKRSIPVSEALAQIKAVGFDGIGVVTYSCDNLEFPVANRFTKSVIKMLEDFVKSFTAKKVNKNTKKVKNVNVKLLDEVRALSMRPEPSAANSVKLGKKAWVIRLNASGIEDFAEYQRPYYIFEQMTTEDVELASALYGHDKFSIALPAVFYNDSLDEWAAIVKLAAELNVCVEVNSWGGIALCREVECQFEVGPGMGVLNGRSADKFAELGAIRVTWSLEADKKILEDLTVTTPLPAVMYVYGYPALMQSRVDFPEAAYGKLFRDRRGISLKLTREKGLSLFRTAEPFSLLRLTNENIKASVFALDLTGAEDPLKEYQAIIAGQFPKSVLNFNYNRSLA